MVNVGLFCECLIVVRLDDNEESHHLSNALIKSPLAEAYPVYPFGSYIKEVDMSENKK